MKPVRTTLIAALLAAFAVTAAVQAQTPPAASAGTGAQAPQESGRHERYARHHQERLTELKQQLQLTPAQEGAWTQFSQSMTPPAMMAHRPDREALSRLPTPERIDQMRALRQQHMAEMDRRAEATKAFYASLTPEQKKRFDEHTGRAMSHRKGGRGHHEGHHG